MRLFMITAAMVAAFAVCGVELDVNIKTLGGNVRGFGVLAKYPDGGPKKIVLTRRISGKSMDTAPDFAGFGSVASLKVFDPDGKEVVFKNIGNQKKKAMRYEITIPDGGAGVWRFSVANGLEKDSYTISFPDSEVWGVRGEMALMPGKKFPNKLYLYVPENAERVLAESFGRRGTFKFSCDGKNFGAFKNVKRRSFLNAAAPKGKVIEGDFSRRSGREALVIDGLPGLWCVSAEAAKELGGGCVKVGKFNLQGAYQARVRNKMLKYSPEELAVKLAPRTGLPAKIDSPRRTALLFGKYGTLESVEKAAAKQILDKNSPFYGAMQIPADRKSKGDWTKFLNHKSYGLTHMPGVIGNIVTLPAELNRAKNNPALVKRACLGAFAVLSTRLSADDIIRENDFRSSNYPHTHYFFVYDSLAKGGYWLKDLLDDEELALWQEGVVRIGDKAASGMGYQSNQWAHMMTGHLYTYLFTGKKRFKEYFELMMNCYLDGTFGTASKYGQHPAGYFLEEYGPDGNYDHLNMYSLVESLWKYRQLSDADGKLVDKMTQAVIKNLEFKKYCWLPAPDGTVYFPNALNCRTAGSLGNPSYPGDYLASFVHPLAYTRWMMNKMPETGVGRADNFPHNAVTDVWAMRLIKAAYDRPPRHDNFSGTWARITDEILAAGTDGKKTELPYQREFSLEQLPGFAAWQQGGIYGASFYAVADGKKRVCGITSGGPVVLWNSDMGFLLASMRNRTPRGRDVRAANLNEVTWAAVCAADAAGKFCFTGKECNTLDGNGSKFVISGALEKNAGKISWQYVPEKTSLSVTVTLESSEWQNPVVTLPFAVTENRKFDLENGKLTIKEGKNSFTVSFSEELQAELSDVLVTSGLYKVRALRIKLPADGRAEIVFSR